jgi:hypothetical protein
MSKNGTLENARLQTMKNRADAQMECYRGHRMPSLPGAGALGAAEHEFIVVEMAVQRL